MAGQRLFALRRLARTRIFESLNAYNIFVALILSHARSYRSQLFYSVIRTFLNWMEAMFCLLHTPF